MKQKLLTLTNQYKSLSISINDDKNWINLFGANYDKFLLRNKGVTIENKEQLLHLLNHKPRTLLSSLRVFVKGLINYNSQLAYRSVRPLPTGPSVSREEGKVSNKEFNLNQVNNDLNLEQSKDQIIRGRIKDLTKSLTENKLALPLNLLTPLLFNKNLTSSLAPAPAVRNGAQVNNSISKTQFSKLINPFKTVNSFEQNISYNFNINNNRKFTQQNITTLLDYAFRGMSSLISKPVFMDTPKNLVINLFYFFIPGQVDLQKQSIRSSATTRSSIRIGHNASSPTDREPVLTQGAGGKGRALVNFNQINNFKFTNLTNMDKLNKLCLILSNILNKPVELDLTRLNAPFFDDNILVKLIGLVSTDLKPIKIFDSIYKNALIFNKRTADHNYSYSLTRSFLAGIKIKIGGRLMTQRIVPKITTRHSQRGATATGKVTYSDWSRVTLKNKRGSHSITVTISHVI